MKPPVLNQEDVEVKIGKPVQVQANVQNETPVEKEIRVSLVNADDANVIKMNFTAFFAEAQKYAEEGMKIIVTDESQTAVMQIARAHRLAVREIRLNAEKARKAMKEDSNRYGKAVQSVYNIVEAICVPVESHLQLQEDYKKIKEQQRIDAIALARTDEMSVYEGLIPDGYDFGNMSSDDYGALKLYAIKIKAESDAKKKEIADADAKVIEDKRLEDERIRKENEQLRKENEELKNKPEPEVVKADSEIDPEIIQPQFVIGHHGLSADKSGIVIIKNLDTKSGCTIPMAEFETLLDNLINYTEETK